MEMTIRCTDETCNPDRLCANCASVSPKHKQDAAEELVADHKVRAKGIDDDRFIVG